MPTVSLPCPKGRFSADGRYYGARNGVNDSCTLCPQGKYAEEDESSACTDCAAGFELPFEGSSSQSDCSACGVGEYANATGTASCSSCASGTYASASATITCATCPEGTWTAGAGGESTCVVCDGGQYGANCQDECQYACRAKGTKAGGSCLRAAWTDATVAEWTELGLDTSLIEIPTDTLYWSEKQDIETLDNTIIPAGMCVCKVLYFDDQCTQRQNIPVSFSTGVASLVLVVFLLFMCALRRRNNDDDDNNNNNNIIKSFCEQYLCCPEGAYQKVAAAIPPLSLARCAILAGDVVERKVRRAQCADLLISRYISGGSSRSHKNKDVNSR